MVSQLTKLGKVVAKKVGDGSWEGCWTIITEYTTERGDYGRNSLSSSFLGSCFSGDGVKEDVSMRVGEGMKTFGQ